MISFLYQSIDWIIFNQVHFFVLFFVYTWIIWLIKAIPAMFYKGYVATYKVDASVVIPVVDEDPKLLESVINKIVEQKPMEVIVVINGKRNLAVEQLCKGYAKNNLRYIWTEKAGKRKALALGFREAKGDIVVIVDSDTIWTKNTLSELLKPFQNPEIGGVTTQQRIYKPERNYLTRFADWLEDTRSVMSMTAMSVMGAVGCLPGRTIAFRKHILLESLDKFLHDEFLGTHLEVSDDRSLTNYTLQMGYKTFYQRSSLVYTDSPDTFGKYVKQQVRWAKGSQYNTLRMLGWMLRHSPYLAVLYISDIITPFFLVSVLVNMLASLITGLSSTEIIRETALDSFATLFVLAVIGAVISLGLRQVAHIMNKPADIVFLPVFTFLVTCVLSPIRIFGFFVMAEDFSWGTRENAYAPENKEDNIKNWLLRKLPYLLGLVLLTFFIWWGSKLR